MKNSYAGLMSAANIPQTEALDSRQVANNGGGFGYAVDDFKRLERFLILGSDGGTYYQSARKLTRENAAAVEKCWAADPERTSRIIANVSLQGRAPKNDPAIFAIALGTLSASQEARQFAYSIVGSVCRTGTHLFQFVATAKAMGKGFGRGMKRAVAAWYLDRDVSKLAYQVVKYRQREGLTHENLLDMARPKADSEDRNAVLAWAVGKLPIDGDVARPASFPDIIVAHERAMKTETAAELLPIVMANRDLPWEALPTWANADPFIQGELLPYMGMTAMVRNLGNLTRMGIIKPLSVAEEIVCDRLRDAEEVKRSKIHPMQILVATKVYVSGRGVAHGGKAPSTWSPSQRVADALRDAFYQSFANVVPSGKRHFVGIDVSDSMRQPISGSAVVACCEAAAAQAMMLMRSEPKTFVGRFNNGLEPVLFGQNSRMEEVLSQTRSINGGGTDCALPMLYAMEKGIEADVFVVITDNETNARGMHPMEALRRYRKKTGIPAKLVVIAMTASNFSIADPQDAGALDVVGFDSSTPAVIADFVGH